MFWYVLGSKGSVGGPKGSLGARRVCVQFQDFSRGFFWDNLCVLWIMVCIECFGMLWDALRFEEFRWDFKGAFL